MLLTNSFLANPVTMQTVVDAIRYLRAQKRAAGEILVQQFDIRDFRRLLQEADRWSPANEREVLEILRDLDAARLVTISTHDREADGVIIHHYLATSYFDDPKERWRYRDLAGRSYAQRHHHKSKED